MSNDTTKAEAETETETETETAETETANMMTWSEAEGFGVTTIPESEWDKIVNSHCLRSFVDDDVVRSLADRRHYPIFNIVMHYGNGTDNPVVIEIDDHSDPIIEVLCPNAVQGYLLMQKFSPLVESSIRVSLLRKSREV